MNVAPPPAETHRRNLPLRLRLRATLIRLYAGRSLRSRLARMAMLAVDVAAIAWFLSTVGEPPTPLNDRVDLAFLAIFGTDYALRLWIAPRPLAHFMKLQTIADLVVVLSLALPLLLPQLDWLRVLRTLRFLRVYRILDEVRGFIPPDHRQRDVVLAGGNLLAFIFVVTSIIFVIEAPINEGIETWLDALYFTVTTLTTTGFGDITMKDQFGRLLAVVVMVFGVALFLKLAQAVFRPHKVREECTECGLMRHDPDASHCKHCGHVVHIRTDGEWI